MNEKKGEIPLQTKGGKQSKQIESKFFINKKVFFIKFRASPLPIRAGAANEIVNTLNYYKIKIYIVRNIKKRQLLVRL